MKRDYQADKDHVYEWLRKHAFGHHNARVRRDILPYILPFYSGDKDRYFRKIASELWHERRIASTATRGYWCIGDLANQEERQACIKSVAELKNKALDMLNGLSRHEEYFNSFIGQARLF